MKLVTVPLVDLWWRGAGVADGIGGEFVAATLLSTSRGSVINLLVSNTAEKMHPRHSLSL